MSYSKLDMLQKHDKVLDADSTFQFLVEWARNMGGIGVLYIQLPKISKKSVLNMCWTVRKLSKRRFTLSSLVAYQMDEVLKAQQTNKSNLYSLKKNLKQMEYYMPDDTNLKRVKIRLPKIVIYELEFLLANMHEEFGEHGYDVESLIQISLVDLLKEMHRGRQDAVQAILASLRVSKEEVKQYEDGKGEILA